MAVFIKKILRQHALPYLHKRTVGTSISMQDNAPCLKAKTVLSFLEEEGITAIKWPPQSPDMNPVENVREIIGEDAQRDILKILMI